MGSYGSARGAWRAGWLQAASRLATASPW